MANHEQQNKEEGSAKVSVVVICRAAEEDAVIGSIGLTQAFVEAGQGATIVFAGEALHALGRGTFRWSECFKGRDARTLIIRNAEKAGIAAADRTRDPRWSDVRALLEGIASDGTIRLVACPVWSSLLGQGAEPAYLETIESSELVALLAAADTIVGGY